MPSYIGPTTLVTGPRRIFLGRRVRILPGLFAETLKSGRIEIGDNVAIGQHFHVSAGGRLSIGEGSTILGFVTITDIDHGYEDVGRPVHGQSLQIRETTLGRNCFIGMGARILPGTSLGDGCVVGANSVVRGVFPAHSVIVGAPASVIKVYNVEEGRWEARSPKESSG